MAFWNSSRGFCTQIGQELWLELPTTDAAAMAGEMLPLVTQYGLSPGKPLSKSLTEAERKTLDEAAKLAGLSGAQLNIFRPWFAALTISNAAITRAGYDPMSGVDSKIEKAFAARGIKPQGLETAELQIKVFAGMTPEQELRYLRETIEEYEAIMRAREATDEKTMEAVAGDGFRFLGVDAHKRTYAGPSA